MKPHQMVKEQCDCYSDNGCLGITIDDHMNPVRFRKEGSKCLVGADNIQRCSHFEQCILPYKPDHKDARNAARLQQEWNEGAHEYRIKTGYMAAAIRVCPQCRKNTIGEGRRVCDLCKAENRRKTKAESDRKRDTESNSHS